jgi:hypothetical protein
MKTYDYAWLAFEEAMRLCPGNKKIINNFLLCMLESKHFTKFQNIFASVRKLLTDGEMNIFKNLLVEFKKACGEITEPVISGMGQKLTNMKKGLGKGMGNKASGMLAKKFGVVKSIKEEEEDD